VLGFVIMVMLARFLGAELFGSYRLGLATVFLLNNFTKLGMDRGLVRFIPIFQQDDLGKIRKLVRDVLCSGTITSLIISAVLYFYSDFLGKVLFHSLNVAYMLRLFAYYLPIFSIFTLLGSILDGLKNGDVEAVIQNIVSPSVYLVFLFCWSFLGLTQLRALSSLMVAHFFSIIVFIYFLRQHHRSLFQTNSIRYNVKKFLRFSIPLSFIGTLTLLMNQVDVFFIGYFKTTTEVGVYSVAYKFAALMLIGLQSVITIFAPHISELYHKNEIVELEHLLKLVTKWIFLIALFLFLFFSIFRVSIINIFGKDFSQASTALIILAFGQLVNSFAGPTGTMLIMSGKQKWEVYNSISLVFFNIFFNVALIPRYGIIGAAIATSSSIIIVNIFKVVETFIELKIHPYSFDMVKLAGILFVACSTGWLLSYAIPSRSIWVALLGGLVMFISSATLLYFFALNDSDKKKLKQLRSLMREVKNKV